MRSSWATFPKTIKFDGQRSQKEINIHVQRFLTNHQVLWARIFNRSRYMGNIFRIRSSLMGKFSEKIKLNQILENDQTTWGTFLK
uniref:AlNc14C255G9707 protein n=1 Tax=Albugo laibachii Nc14 TaxID=890382 RepID=F0WTN0_9STRA|nr:AlNc14C255G9707 [Albugo laibachii Nc14]|eukprot:CCA24722.1 AlNc14C255G9707 [Albugo laibachii Nc14]